MEPAENPHPCTISTPLPDRHKTDRQDKKKKRTTQTKKKRRKEGKSDSEEDKQLRPLTTSPLVYDPEVSSHLHLLLLVSILNHSSGLVMERFSVFLNPQLKLFFQPK